ncbi:peptide-methionine (R)-S-oxide reductase [Siphonobacter sp. SORGH_AS 1065]|nr:peptide-methionine (R)-S-oxide reductase [Siphonobacter sp. SORGH_AS_1065]
MERRHFLKFCLITPLVGTLLTQNPVKRYPVEKTDSEWKRILTPEQYFVTRQKGTERAFSGKFWNNREKGSYRCVCCNAELFKTDAQFDNGSGWPTFSRVANPRNVEETEMPGGRGNELTCSRCGAYLGRSTPDGSAPGRLKYTINSAALLFERNK